MKLTNDQKNKIKGECLITIFDDLCFNYSIKIHHQYGSNPTYFIVNTEKGTMVKDRYKERERLFEELFKLIEKNNDKNKRNN